MYDTERIYVIKYFINLQPIATVQNFSINAFMYLELLTVYLNSLISI